MYKKLMYVMLCVSLGMVLCGTAIASPCINGAVITERIFNDNPNSVVISTNSYAASITIDDNQVNAPGGGWANLHIFRLSADGGNNPASFANDDGFGFAADVTLTGTGNSEGGLNIAPWWSLNVDGRFMINTGGEIAVFGGRLPFYSFTNPAGYNLHYTKGDTVRLGVVYRPNSLSELDPATIVYIVTMDGNTYCSGELPFDEGNPAENPPHGVWGMLTPAQVGGYFQPQVWDTKWEQVTFGNMNYVPEPATMTILALGSLFLARRRRRK